MASGWMASGFKGPVCMVFSQSGPGPRSEHGGPQNPVHLMRSMPVHNITKTQKQHCGTGAETYSTAVNKWHNGLNVIPGMSLSHLTLHFLIQMPE